MSTSPAPRCADLRWKRSVRFLAEAGGDQVALVDLADRRFLKLHDDARRAVDRRITGQEPRDPAEREGLDRLIKDLLARGYLTDGTVEPPQRRYIRSGTEARTAAGEATRPPNRFLDTPKIVYFAITERCNLTCATCYATPRVESCTYQGDTRATLEVLERIAAINARRLILTGGEPLLRRDVFELISHAKRLGLDTAMTTNGTLLDPVMAAGLATAGLDDVQVSIDSHVAARHDAVRGPGSFDKAIAAVRALRAAGYAKEHVFMAATSTREGLDDVEAYFRLADELGATVNFSFYQAVGRGTAERRPTTDQLVQLTRTRLKRYEARLGGCGAPSPSGRSCLDSEVHVGVGCGLGLTTIAVRENGDVLPCHLFLSSSDHIIGNVKSDELPAAALRFQESLPGVDEVEACRTCDVRYFCHNGCRGGIYLETGDFGNRSAYCDYFKRLWSAIVWTLGQDREVERVLATLRDAPQAPPAVA